MISDIYWLRFFNFVELARGPQRPRGSLVKPSAVLINHYAVMFAGKIRGDLGVPNVARHPFGVAGHRISETATTRLYVPDQIALRHTPIYFARQVDVITGTGRDLVNCSGRRLTAGKSIGQNFHSVRSELQACFTCQQTIGTRNTQATAPFASPTAIGDESIFLDPHRVLGFHDLHRRVR